MMSIMMIIPSSSWFVVGTTHNGGYFCCQLLNLIFFVTRMMFGTRSSSWFSTPFISFTRVVVIVGIVGSIPFSTFGESFF